MTAMSSRPFCVQNETISSKKKKNNPHHLLFPLLIHSKLSHKILLEIKFPHSLQLQHSKRHHLHWRPHLWELNHQVATAQSPSLRLCCIQDQAPEFLQKTLWISPGEGRVLFCFYRTCKFCCNKIILICLEVMRFHFPNQISFGLILWKVGIGFFFSLYIMFRMSTVWALSTVYVY